jgi:hypothetical protein
VRLFCERIANEPLLLLEVVRAGVDAEVVIEATYGWYWAVDRHGEAGFSVHLAHPSGNDWGNRRVKNDERDACDLAELLRLGRLAEAWIAPPAVREAREIVKYRAKLGRLTPQHRESDTKVVRGKITKQGSKLVRWAALEAIVRYHGGPPLRDHFHRVAERRGTTKARIATARRLMTLVYYGLRDGEIRCLQRGRRVKLGHAPSAFGIGMTPTRWRRRRTWFPSRTGAWTNASLGCESPRARTRSWPRSSAPIVRGRPVVARSGVTRARVPPVRGCRAGVVPRCTWRRRPTLLPARLPGGRRLGASRACIH